MSEETKEPKQSSTEESVGNDKSVTLQNDFKPNSVRTPDVGIPEK